MHHAQLAELINRGSSATTSALAGFNAAGMSTEQALGQINRMVDQQAFMLAANDVFYGSAIIFVMLVPLVWLSHPARSKGPVSDPADNAAVGAH